MLLPFRPDEALRHPSPSRPSRPLEFHLHGSQGGPFPASASGNPELTAKRDNRKVKKVVDCILSIVDIRLVTREKRHKDGTRLVVVRVPAELHERVWDVLRPRNGLPRRTFQEILFEPVCAALRAASGDQPEQAQPALGTGSGEALDARMGDPELPHPLAWCQEGTRCVTTGSPEETAKDSSPGRSPQKVADAGGREPRRHGGERGETPSCSSHV